MDDLTKPSGGCAMCSGSGSVSNGRDERGRPREKTCPNCGGNGEVG